MDPKYENARKMNKVEFNQFLEDMRMRAYDNFWKIKWPCPYCGKKFETKLGLERHQLMYCKAIEDKLSPK